MIVSSGFRGFGSRRRMGRASRMRGLNFNGYGASLGDTWVYDENGNMTVVPDSTDGTSATDVGTVVEDIGTGLGNLLGGLAKLFGSTQTNPSTNPVGGQPRPAQGFTVSPLMLIGGAALAVGAVVLLTKKK